MDANVISVAARTAGNQDSLSVFLNDGKVTVNRTAVPKRPPGFALLELILAGICNTDLELQRGYYNFRGIPGHEFVAKVIDCDNARLLNQRVVGEINLACGTCDFCKQGMGRHCYKRRVLGILSHPGAFAQYFTLAETNLHVVPEGISDREAVFVEPLAAACEILDQVQFAKGSEVAVLGDGKLGLLITQVLLAHDLRVTLYGRHESKLLLARAAGATVASSGDLPKSTYSYVIECTGSAGGFASAVQMARPRGTIVMKSTIHEPITIDTAPIIVNEISLIGSRCGRFEPALALLQNRRVNVKPMVEAEFPLSEAALAFECAATRGTLKVLLAPK